MVNATVSTAYDESFASNLGLVQPEEQAMLRRATVAIPGLGGAGGAHLLTLARLGVGRFVVADGDRFERRNINRQVGATEQTFGRLKADVLTEMAKGINPELAIRVMPEEIGPGNVDAFLDGVDVIADGIDFFRVDARRLVFNRARAKGISVVTCAPLGFSAAMLVFTPDGPSFDEYFAIAEGMSELEQLARFAVGLAPAGLHLPYIDLKRISLKEHRGPSSIVAINCCAGFAASEILCILLKRRAPWAVPRFAQFDPYRLRFKKGRLWMGNRHPWQRLKLWALKRRLRDDFGG